MNISDQASQVIDLVKAAGASGDLIIDQGESLSLKAREGDLEEDWDRPQRSGHLHQASHW